MDFVRDEERCRNRRTDRGCDWRSLRQPDRADHPRSTYRRIAAVQFAAHERHGHDAYCRVPPRPGSRGFRLPQPRLTGPLGNGHTILRHHVECSPCFLRECPIDFRCMKAVSTDEVAEAVLSMLAK